MLRKSILALFFLGVFFTGAAQDYKTGLGVRLSPQFHCIDVKHFFSNKIALEGMLNITRNTATIVMLGEFNNKFNGQPGLAWYWGLGGAVRIPNEGSFVISADGILGLEYTFSAAPINLSLDWKPAVEIINGSNAYPSGFGLSVRFLFR